jgi:hypothetical protein
VTALMVRIWVGSLWAFRHGEPLGVSDLHVSDDAVAMLRTEGLP